MEIPLATIRTASALLLLSSMLHNLLSPLLLSMLLRTIGLRVALPGDIDPDSLEVVDRSCGITRREDKFTTGAKRIDRLFTYLNQH